MDFKLVLTPPKRPRKDFPEELEEEKDAPTCAIHSSNYDKETTIRKFTENSWGQVKAANNVRQKDDVTQLLLNSPELPGDNFGYHPKCYDLFTHKKSLAILKRQEKTKNQQNVKRLPSRKKFRLGKVLADKECCICGKRKTKKTGSGWEVLEKCETESGAQSLQKAALERNDNPHLMAEMSGIDVQVIVAKEFYYHRSCKRDYTRVETRRKKALDKTPFEGLVEYIQTQVISGGKVKSMTDV
eukprot:gene21367-23447_t